MAIHIDGAIGSSEKWCRACDLDNLGKSDTKPSPRVKIRPPLPKKRLISNIGSDRITRLPSFLSVDLDSVQPMPGGKWLS